MTVAVLLTPGASATRDSPALVAIERAVADAGAGVVVERIDLPSSTAGPKVYAAITGAAAALAQRAGVEPGRVFLGGRSFGGRMCSVAVADGVPALGLVLVSYPLHPPGRPEKARTEHLPRLQVPCLFVSGTRDAFATPTELQAATAAIPGPVTHVWVEGGSHGLGGRDAEVAAAVRSWVEEVAGPRG
jgi:predicted alpha/beta-hydrolase family hydrolase